MTVFVKSVKTTVPVRNSKNEVEELLRRYGCSKMQITENYHEGLFAVAFALPDTPGSNDHVPVRIEVKVSDVARVVQKTFKTQKNADWLNAQAQRVAWRHLVLWLDAALSAATLGLQRISEAFYAHIILDGGQRLIERVTEQGGAIGINSVRLLGSGQ